MLLIASYLVMKTLLFSCVKSDDDLCVVLLLTFVSTVNFSDELLTSTFGKICVYCCCGGVLWSIFKVLSLPEVTKLLSLSVLFFLFSSLSASMLLLAPYTYGQFLVSTCHVKGSTALTRSSWTRSIVRDLHNFWRCKPFIGTVTHS